MIDITLESKAHCYKLSFTLQLLGPCIAARASSPYSRDRLFLFPTVVGIQVQTQTLGVQVQLVLAARLLQDLSNVPCILDLSELDVTLALLDRISDQLCRASLTLSADDRGLLLLTGFVNKESCSLGLLLGDLFGFNCSREFRREGKVLEMRNVLVDSLNDNNTLIMVAYRKGDII